MEPSRDAPPATPTPAPAGSERIARDWAGWLAVAAVALTDGGVAALLGRRPAMGTAVALLLLAGACGVAWALARAAATGSSASTGPRRRGVRGVLARLAAPRPPRGDGGAPAWHLALAATLIVLAMELYYAVARHVFGLDGVAQLGSLGESFGPLNVGKRNALS